MTRRIAIAVAVMACSTGFTATLLFSQQSAPAQSPEWFLQGSAPDPGGRAIVGPGGRVISTGSPAGGGFLVACSSEVAQYCAGQSGPEARACLVQNSDRLSPQCRSAVVPAPDACTHSP